MGLFDSVLNYLGIGQQQANKLPENLPTYNGWVPDTQPSQTAGSSAQLTPQAQQQVNNSGLGKFITGGNPPASTPPPSSPPSNNNNSNNSKSFNINNYPGYQGWDANAAYQDWLATGGAGKGGSTGGSPSVNLDQIFNPLYAGIDQQAQDLDKYQSADTETLNKSKADLLTQAQNRFNEALGDSQDNELRLTNSRDSAMKEAIRLKNALSQRASSMFGAFSSAGGAVNEISNQEFARQGGQIADNYGQQYAQLLKDRTKLGNWYNETKTKIETDTQAQLSSLMKSYNDARSSLALARHQLDSQKAQAAANQVESIRQQVAQVNAAKISQLLNLQSFAVQTAMTQNQSYQQLMQNLAKIDMIAKPTNGINVSAPTQARPGQLAYNPQTGKYTDEWGNLIEI